MQLKDAAATRAEASCDDGEEDSEELQTILVYIGTNERNGAHSSLFGFGDPRYIKCAIQVGKEGLEDSQLIDALNVAKDKLDLPQDIRERVDKKEINGVYLVKKAQQKQDTKPVNLVQTDRFNSLNTAGCKLVFRNSDDSSRKSCSGGAFLFFASCSFSTKVTTGFVFSPILVCIPVADIVLVCVYLLVCAGRFQSSCAASADRMKPSLHL